MRLREASPATTRPQRRPPHVAAPGPGLGTVAGSALPQARRLGADIQRAAQKKLRLLNAAGALNDLRVPPGNRLEKLTGDRVGQHSIRVNDQYRICFIWTAGGPADVENVDYH